MERISIECLLQMVVGLSFTNQDSQNVTETIAYHHGSVRSLSLSKKNLNKYKIGSKQASLEPLTKPNEIL